MLTRFNAFYNMKIILSKFSYIECPKKSKEDWKRAQKFPKLFTRHCKIRWLLCSIHPLLKPPSISIKFDARSRFTMLGVHTKHAMNHFISTLPIYRKDTLSYRLRAEVLQKNAKLGDKRDVLYFHTINQSSFELLLDEKKNLKNCGNKCFHSF